MFPQDAECICICFGNYIMHFLIDQFGYAFTVIAFVAKVLTQEDLFLLFPEYHRPQLAAHAQAGNHLADNTGNALKITRCTAADFVEYNLFCSPATQGDADLCQIV